MTKEQWLVYIWSIYPNGGFLLFWVVCLCGVATFLFIIAGSFFADTSGDRNYRYSEKEKDAYLWRKLGKWKVIVPSILLLLIFISNLVPNREYFAYIIATPYVVDSGKSIVDSLNDPTSKLFKLNSIMDKGLDKTLKYLDESKQSEPEE